MKYIKTFESKKKKKKKNAQFVKLEDLVGNHILSGVDLTLEEIKTYNSETESNVVVFVLDGKTYKVYEDPDDGYRSYCGEIKVCDDKVSNMFYPHEVIGKMKLSDVDGDECEILQFFDVETKDVVLEIGTGNTGDYYPYCVMYWYPENLELNRAMNKYNL